MEPQTKRLAVATILGVVIFLTDPLVPSPIDKMFIVVQALLLALGALIIGKTGATSIGAIGGALTALWRLSLAPFTFFFALLYGLLVDGFFFILKVNTAGGEVKAVKLITAMTTSTAIVGLLSYYTMVFVTSMIERNLMLEITVLIAGTLGGTTAGYLATTIWNRYLKNFKL